MTTREFVTMDEAIAQLIQQLGEGKPRVLSHLSPREHAAISVALAFNGWAKIKALDIYCNSYLELAPSRHGKSRKQLTSIGIASMGPPPSEEVGRVSRFINWARGRNE